MLRKCYSFFFLLIIFFTACKSKVDENNEATHYSLDSLPKPLLASRFENLEALKKQVEIRYYNENLEENEADSNNIKVVLTYTIDGKTIQSDLSKGVSQSKIYNAKNESFLKKIELVFIAPFAISNRQELFNVNILARRMQDFTGWGDPAFYDLSELTVSKIAFKASSFKNVKDKGEKGYLNTFNHITAQAIITSIYGKEFADFIGDIHERKNLPELTTGVFSIGQLNDIYVNPTDNYADMINNEIGQQIGLILAEKYHISIKTRWTETLLCDYLNDLQTYYSRSFGIPLAPFKSDEEIVIRFVNKMNRLLNHELRLST